VTTQTRFSLVAAVHLFLLRDQQVLLLRRYQTGYEDGNYSVIAGHLEGGEEIKAAMAREAWEETGIILLPDNLTVVGVMHRCTDEERVDFFLTASQWSGELINREPEKCDDLRWYRRDALPDNIVPYVRQALENVWRGQWFDSYGWHEGGRR